jgi:hypothetical protein
MTQENTGPVSVISLRADGYSSEGKSLILSLTTKYSTAERKYSVPVECFHDLIVDLQRLNATAGGAVSEPSAAQNPSRDLNRLTVAA